MATCWLAANDASIAKYVEAMFWEDGWSARPLASDTIPTDVTANSFRPIIFAYLADLDK